MKISLIMTAFTLTKPDGSELVREHLVNMDDLQWTVRQYAEVNECLCVAYQNNVEVARFPIQEKEMAKLIFVFGSNEAGIHGAGAAKFAHKHKGARYGKSYGHIGDSFAIPTKDTEIETMPLDRIQDYVTGFLAYARGHRKLAFQVTCIGCGLAGYKHKDIAPMFLNAPQNCHFDENWREFLGDSYNYWGTM